MLRQLSVHIPKSEWPEIQEFLNTPVESLHAVTDCLTQARPLPDVETLAEQCHNLTQVPQNKVEAMLGISINLSRLQRSLDKSIREVLEEVAVALKQAGFPEWDMKYSQAWQDRISVLEQVLTTDGVVEIMSKIRELLYDFQCVFLNSTVLTDVRHVYNSNASEIKGGLILHTLNLEYIESMEPHQIHIAMSAVDIEKLIRQLERAQQKARGAEALLKQVDVPELTPRKNL